MNAVQPAPLEVDVVVIGGGSAGEVVAGRCAGRGLETVLVEQGLIGGECSYWGCIPSKTLLRAGEALASAARVPGAAAAVTGVVDVTAALARRDHMASHWMDAGQERWLADHGVRLLRSEEHTSELQSRQYLVCRLLLEKKTTSLSSIAPSLS